MNQPIVLLLAQPEDDLPIPDEAPRFNTFGYVTNDTIHTSLHVSNWADAAINEAMLTWEVVGFNSEEHIAICSEQVVVTHVAQGPPTTWVANISCGLPNRGSFYDDPKEPLALTLRATLVGLDHKILSSNSWRSRLYAMYQAGVSVAIPSPNLSLSKRSPHASMCWCRRVAAAGSGPKRGFHIHIRGLLQQSAFHQHDLPYSLSADNSSWQGDASWIGDHRKRAGCDSDGSCDSRSNGTLAEQHYEHSPNRDNPLRFKLVDRPMVSSFRQVVRRRPKGDQQCRDSGVLREVATRLRIDGTGGLV